VNESLESIAALKSEWDALQPLSAENERRLWQKLRLEWNYHSNHIEGNTLTYGETELLLLHDQTHGTHSLREYEEMKAHDVGIEHLRNLAKDRSRIINLGEIRDLNRIILKEPFWKHAETTDGKPTRKQIVPGEYKTVPNNVRTATGGIFEFAPPHDVEARMHSLVDWLSQTLASPSFDLVATLAKLHHDFVLIHPFDDGNGRVARMLVNYVLLHEGYPQIIVPTEEKKDYLAALRLADAGDPTPLAEYLAKCLRWVLLLAIRAGKGESIEEAGDIEKQIALFARSQEHHKEKVKPRSSKALNDLYESGLKSLFQTALEKMNVFAPLFVRVRSTAEPQFGESSDAIACFEHHLSQGFRGHNHFVIWFNLEGYRGEAASPFNLQTNIRLNFEEFAYTLTAKGAGAIRKLYSEPVLSDEIAVFIESLLRAVFQDIQQNVKKH
jgi:Fic family protein